MEEQLNELSVTSAAQILALQERNSALERKMREQVCPDVLEEVRG